MTVARKAPEWVVRRDPLTVAEVWRGLTGEPLTEAVLDWPPDVAVLTSVLVERAQLFRFVLSPPRDGSWPPVLDAAWPAAVGAAACAWVAAVGEGTGRMPDLVVEQWRTIILLADTPIDEVVAGRPWALCEALLALHAIADEATAGAAACRRDGDCLGRVVYLGRVRELLARTGSMARITTDRARVVPRVRTATSGITHRSLSRYASVRTDGMRVVWHKASVRRSGDEAFRQANLLLLPWPMVVHERDFRPLGGSIRRPEREPFGLFAFAPAEPVDLDLVDRLLGAALEEVDQVDGVVLPEGAVGEDELAGLEEVLSRHRTPLLIAGTRIAPDDQHRLGDNVVHVGALVGGRWWHYRQAKHHRWYLEANQIAQYHLGGALHPRVRWWEAMGIPERSVQFLELGDGITIATVICEDLARLDGVADLLRSVGPTLIFVLLLDGPQITPRWTARYATVFADDPGSTVLTLTSYGMVRRSQPPGLPPSRAVAMWKDAVSGPREIELEAGAQGVLLTTALDRATRYVADGRSPADDGVELLLAGLHQVRDGSTPPGTPGGVHDRGGDAELDSVDLSVLVGWAETLAEAMVMGAAAVEEVACQMAGRGPWRAQLGLEAPALPLARGLEALGQLARRTAVGAGDVCVADALAALERSPDGSDGAHRLVRRALRNALGTVCARRP